MIFRNIIFSAVFAGIIAGLIYGLFQATQISPIIYAAEEFEVAESAIDVSADGHDHSQDQETEGHSHNHEAGAPQSELKRQLYTISSTILASISFALILIALMYWHNLKSNKPKVTWFSGLGWGLALMLSFFVSPVMFGLHPEVPGTQAAQLEHRQIWWLFCVSATMAGLVVLYYMPMKFKLAGIALIVLPHVLGAPHISSELTFANQDPAAISALTELTKQFYNMTSIGMFIFCITLGTLSGFAVNRF